MARIKIENIVDHLDSEFRKALRDTVLTAVPDAFVDERDLFRVFKRAVARRCSTWEAVPDRYVEHDGS